MKKLLASLFAFCAVIKCIGQSEQIDDIVWEYSVADGGATVEKVPISTMGAVAIPNKLGNYPVVGIGGHAFRGCEKITSISIPSTVRSITYYLEDSPFSGCAELSTFSVDASNGYFASSKGILYSKDMSVLVCCPPATTSCSLNPLAEVVEIGQSAFFGCKKLSYVSLPSGLRKIGKYAFYNCLALKSITLPKSLQIIDEFAFAYMALETVSIPSSTEYVGGGAFSNSGLQWIVIPDSVTELGEGVCMGCHSLTAAWIGAGVKRLEMFTFAECYNLKDVYLSNEITDIFAYAFRRCYSLERLDVPASVENLWGISFMQCTNLMSVAIDSNNANYTTVAGSVYSKDMRELVMCPNGVEAITVPDGVEQINRYAFHFCSKLSTVVLPASLSLIQKDTFYETPYKTIIFEGDAPTVEDGAKLDSASIFVTKKSEGWNVPIPGFWNGMKIDYMKPCTVTFDANGGVGSTTQIIDYCWDITILPVVTMAGHEFKGWYTAKTGGTKISVPITIRSDITYYAHWEGVMDTISFETHGGGSIPSIQRERGKVIGDLPIPTREGYSFLGWFLDDTDGDSISESYVVSGPLTLHARWKIRSYSLTLDLNYGGQLERISYEYGTAIGEIETPKRLGYVFRCWSMDVYGNIPVDRDFIITKDVTFYAQWSLDICWVVFDLNFKGATNVSRPYAFGAELGFIEDPEREGYEFVGWFTAPDEGTEVCSSSIVTGDATYYAHWRVISHVVSLCLNYDGRYLEDEERAHGSPVGALPSPIRSGYSFLGWFLANGECVHGEMIVMSDIVLFAHWKENTDNWFTISFDAQGGEVDPKTFKVKSEITSLPVPVWHGYEFIGWAAQKIGGDIIGRGGPCEPFAVTEDMTLYAYWRPMYYKLCLASDIIGVPADMCSYQIGQDVKLSNPFHNPGYTFLGWGLDYKKNGGQVVYVEDQVVPSLSDVEGQRVWLYAIWGEPEPLDFPTALNVDCSLTWTTGGKAGWKAMATDVACDGISCARSGDISSYENSWVETTVEGAGTLEFSWKNTCKTDDDSFGLIIDGKLQGSCYGGNARWQKMTVKLGKGTHTLRWVYERGYSYGSAATGYGYIDNVMWVPATTYYIEFVANGGKGTMECQEMVSNLEAKLNLNSFVKEDCHFCGWALNSDGIVVYGDGQSVCGLNPDENGIVRLYAIWEPSYSFTFRSLDATSVEVTGMSVSGQMSGRIVIPERINDKNVVKIGASAFSGRNEIYSVSIPATVNKIGSSAFSGCVNLRSVSLEEGVVEIADLAFSQCASLQYVNIPLSVETIGCSAFKGCAGLGDGVVVVDDCVLTVNGECPTDVRLPSNIRILTSGTFMSCESLASITIPPGIDNIGMRTFAWCSKLGFVALPSTITNLDFMAFSCCSSLKSITIPSSVVTIGEAAFMLCGALEKIGSTANCRHIVSGRCGDPA